MQCNLNALVSVILQYQVMKSLSAELAQSVDALYLGFYVTVHKVSGLSRLLSELRLFYHLELDTLV